MRFCVFTLYRAEIAQKAHRSNWKFFETFQVDSRDLWRCWICWTDFVRSKHFLAGLNEFERRNDGLYHPPWLNSVTSRNLQLNCKLQSSWFKSLKRFATIVLVQKRLIEEMKKRDLITASVDQPLRSAKLLQLPSWKLLEKLDGRLDRLSRWRISRSLKILRNR